MPDPFTIRIFVPDGDPEGVRLVSLMNWTGLGVAFPRAKWPEVRQRPELQGAGVYILIGYAGDEENDDLPTLYIGQADGAVGRIDSHIGRKEFWDRAIVFVSTASDGLNRAHVTWLEYALVKRATEARQCHLDNGNAPQEPTLNQAEKADMRGFLKEVLQILPLVGLHAFESPRAVATPQAADPAMAKKPILNLPDTIIVPARKEGFERVFLGEDCWYSVRISDAMIDKIKYIAAYRIKPVQAITHYAPVAQIESYGDRGKYKLIFSGKAKEIGPIPLGNAPQGAMQGPRYFSFARLREARTLAELIGKG